VDRVWSAYRLIGTIAFELREAPRPLDLIRKRQREATYWWAWGVRA